MQRNSLPISRARWLSVLVASGVAFVWHLAEKGPATYRFRFPMVIAAVLTGAGLAGTPAALAAGVTGPGAPDTLFEVAVIRHTQCGTGFLADPGFRQRAAEATGLPEAALEASAVADPHTTVRAGVERLLISPSLSPKVSVSGRVYDIATGHVTTTHHARYP